MKMINMLDDVVAEPVMPVPEIRRQEGQEFKASLS